MFMAYIYKISNNINNKVYIGKTISTIENRWAQHKYDYKNRSGEKRPLYEAMKKYGIEYFYIEQIEECPTELVEEREKYWIKYYNSYIGFPNSRGYNATLGGDGTLRANRALVFELWQNNNTRTQIKNITKYDLATITNILKEFGISDEAMKQRKIESAKRANSQKVAKIDLNTGEILHIYNSIAEANKDVGASGHITSVCKGKRKSCKGFGWKYIN